LVSLKDVATPLDISEVKTQPSEKFLGSRDLVASGWVKIPALQYTLKAENRCTVCQLELDCSVNVLLPERLDQVAPIVIAAVDIEVQSGDFRSFPDSSRECDPCTYIGTTFWVYGERVPRVRVMQVLGECDPVDTMVVESYDSELELLLAWRDLIAIRGNPDKIVSFNGTGFDFKYMADRVELLLGKLNRARAAAKPRQQPRTIRFYHLGRFLAESKKLFTRELESAAMGQNEISMFPMQGRWQMDLFQYVKTNYKLSSYKLDDVCAHFLKGAAHASKVVLDYPGWVASCVEKAKAWLLTSSAELTSVPNQELDALTSVALEQAHHPLTVTTTDEFEKDIENTLGGEDGDPDAVSDEAMRYIHAHKTLEKAVDVFSKLIESLSLPAEQQAILRAGMDQHVQPALDASGSDNYKKLFRLYCGTKEHRAAVARYCQVDCDLLLFLMDRISVVPNTVQMSQVCHTLLNDIANRGQQIKTFNQIARYASKRGFVMNFRNTGWDPTAEYEGATVLPPRPGYYQTPVATLDFASLYPSIMQAYNLCFSSIVLDEEHQGLQGATYGRYPIAGREWVFQEHKPGLLPEILADLVAARRRVKKEMERYEKGSLDYKLADGKQLALKISCNSVYGFCGVLNNGMFPCMPVAVATTFNGRNLIQITKEFVESRFNGGGATVIYGDTDSVMIQFPGVTTVADAFRLAERAAKEATANLPCEGVKLEFEKVYLPYLLIKKKHYAGMKYEGDPDDPPYLDAKGLALVRRDNCLLVRTVMKEVLHACMRDNNPLAAYEAVERHVNRLVRREVGMEELEISNALRKDLKDDHHPHIQVVKNMTARHSFGVPRVGDRVPYVILEGSASSKIYQRAEHPKYVAEANLKVDLEYYLRNQLQKRLEKVLTPLPIPSAEALFNRASREIERRRIGNSRLDSFAGFAPTARPEEQPVSKRPKVVETKVKAAAPVQTRLDGTISCGGAAAKKKAPAKKAAAQGKQLPLTNFLTKQ
jgi:DNA polymerase elongation subunit (family B)